MMTFTKDSALVKTWADLLLDPASPLSQESIPSLSNLREMVLEAVNERTENDPRLLHSSMRQ